MSAFRMVGGSDGRTFPDNAKGRPGRRSRRRRLAMNMVERLEDRTLLSFSQITTPAAYPGGTTNMTSGFPANGTSTSAITAGGETVTFSSSLTAEQMPFSPWSGNWGTAPTNVQSNIPRILESSAFTGTLTMNLSSPASVFGFEMSPASGAGSVTATFQENGATVGTVTLSPSNGGALQFAGSTNQAFTSVTLALPGGDTGVAIAQPTFTLANAALGISKTVANTSLNTNVNPPNLVDALPGNTVVYTITASNGGPNDAVGASVTDVLPAGVTFMSATTPAGWTMSASGTTNTWTNAVFTQGSGTATFTITGTVSSSAAAGTVISDTASAGSSDSTTVVSNAANFTVVGPNLSFTGNNFRIIRDAANPNLLDFFVDSNPEYQQIAGTIQTVTLNGLQGNDTLTVDDSNGLVTNNPPISPVATPLTINYYANSNGVNQLIVQQPSGTTLGASSAETIAVGGNSGAGADLITSDGSTANTQTVFFDNVASFFTSVPTPSLNIVPSPTGIAVTNIPPQLGSVLQSSLLNATSTINYTEGSAPGGTTLSTSWGRVTADSFASLNFRNKDALNITTGAGNTVTNLNNTAASATTPVGYTAGALKTISVAGTASFSNNLIVNGTAAADAIGVTPTSTNAGTVSVTAAGPVTLPTVTFTGTAALTINGQGGGDTLTVTGPSGATDVVAPGSAVDSGTVLVNNLVPLAYSNLGTAGSVVLAGGGGANTLKYDGHDAGDTYTVAATTGVITSVGSPGTYIPVSTGGTGTFALNLVGDGGASTFNVTAPDPYLGTSIVSNADPSAGAVTNLTGTGTAVSVTLGGSTTTITGGGLGTVANPLTITGNGAINLTDNVGVSVTGTTGISNSLAVTPTGAHTASIIDNGTSPSLNVTTTATLTVAGTTGDQDTITVNGPSGGGTIAVAKGTTTSTVTVNSLLPVTIPTAGGNTTALVVSTGLGTYTVNVTGTGGPQTVTVAGSQVPAADTLNITNSMTGTTTTVTPGATNDSGTVTSPDGTISFSGLANVSVTGAGTGNTLVALGTPGGGSITALHQTSPSANVVAVNNRALLAFSGFATLTLNSGTGADAFNVSPSGLTGVTAINVTSGGSAPTSTLLVNGASGDNITYTPTNGVVGSGTVAIATLPTVSFTAISALSVNGQGGNDTLTVVTPTGANSDTLTPGPGVDAGSLVITNGTGSNAAATATPLTFSNLGATGLLTLNNATSPTDTFVYNAPAGNSTFTVGVVTGADQVTLATSQNAPGAQIPVRLLGASSVILNGAAGNDTFNVTGALATNPATINLEGSGAAGSGVANLTGNATLATVTLGGTNATVTGGGLNTVLISGIANANLGNTTGPVTVIGTAGINNSLAVTPISSSSSSVQDNGKSPLVTETTTGTFTVSGTASPDQDTITVSGPSGGGTIAIAKTTTISTVTVNSLQPISIPTASPNTTALVVSTGLGTYAVNVSGTGGPQTVTVAGSQVPAADTLNITNATAGTTTTVTPGTTNDAGTVTSPDGTVAFSGLATLNITGTATGTNTLIALGTAGNDTITAQHSGAVNTIAVNSRAALNFANFANLTLNGLTGTDAFNVSPSGLTGVTAISVLGTAPSLTDSLLVNGASGANITYTPTSGVVGSGTVAIVGLPTVSFAAVGSLSVNGQGGNDTLTVVTPTGANTDTLTPGPGVDAGSLVITNAVGTNAAATATPLTFSNLGSTGLLTLNNATSPTDTFVYNAPAGNSTFTVGVVTGADQVTLAASQNAPTAQIPVRLLGASSVILNGAAGNDTFNVTGALATNPATINLEGSGATGSGVANLTGNATAATVTLGGTNATVTGGGLNTVLISGIANANLSNTTGAVMVIGTAGINNALAVTPISSTQSTVQDNGKSPLVTVTNTAGTPLTVSGTASPDQDTITVNGTSGNDTIGITRGAPTGVLVNSLQQVNVTGAGSTALVVATGLGTDTVNVSGTGGPASLTVNGGQTPAADTLNVTTTSSGTSTVTPGTTSDAGTIATPDGTTAFTGMTAVSVTTTASGAAFTANGTNGNDTITAQSLGGSDRVWVNAQAVATFAGFTTLNLAGRFSNDAFIVSPSGMSPDGAATLSTINVTGVNPNATDSLTINGASGAAIGYTPSSTIPSTVTIAGAPTVTFANIATAAVNGQGGGDTLTVTGPSGATFNDALGSAVDSGTVQVNSLTPLAYSNLGAAGAIAFAGTGGADKVNLTGPNTADTYTVAATTGAITIAGTAGSYLPITPTNTGGTLALSLNSPGGAAQFTVTAGATTPYATIAILGNSTATGNAVATLNGNGTPITVTTGPTGTTVTGGGLATTSVLVSGTETLNLNAGAGAVTVMGTAGQTNNLVVTPTATGGSVSDNGAAPFVNVSTTGTFTVAGTTAADGDTLTVDGTGGNDTYLASGGTAAPTIKLNSLTPVALGANLADLDLTDTGGNNTLTVNSTAGAFPVPINFNAGPGTNKITLVGGAPAASATSDTYTPGPGVGAGSDVLVISGVTQTVNFTSLTPVIDTVPGPLTVMGTNGNDAITYAAVTDGNQGVVSVNNLETIEFGSKTSLAINTLNGTDTVNITNTTATTATGLTGITVTGGSLSGGDTLIIDGTSSVADAIGYTPTPTASPTAGSGTVTVAPLGSTALPPVMFTGIANLAINGQGGGDTLTVNGPSGATFNDALGSAVDSGTIQVNSLTPLAYSNLGTLGSVVLAGSGGADKVNLAGHEAGDTYTVAAAGGVTIAGTAGTYIPITPTNTGGTLALTLTSPGGSATFNVTAPATGTSPYVSTTIQGNSNLSGGAVTNLTGNGTTTAAVTLGNSSATVTGGGLGAVTVTGTESVNLNNGTGMVSVVGTTGQPNALSVTPTGASSATVQDNGLSPVLKVTTTAVTTTGILTIGGTTGDVDTIQVNGTGGPDVITAALGAMTTVTVAAGGVSYLPVNISTPTPNTLGLIIGSSTGQDTINVTGSGGPATLLTIGGSPTGLDTLGYTTSLSGTTTITASSTPGAGSIAAPGGVAFQFAGISTINVSSTAGASTSALTVLGSNGNDAITAQAVSGANTVSINSQPLATFTGYGTLNLNGQGGSDSFDVSPSGLTGVTAINVSGLSPSDTDQLTVNGVSGAAIGYTPSAVGAGTITVAGAPTVTFANVASAAVNGQGGGDKLTVTGPSGATFNDALGSAVDSGTVQVNSLTPLVYSNLGAAGTIAFAGTGGADTVNLTGPNPGDTYTVAATTGAVTIAGAAGTYLPITPTNGSGTLALTLNSPGGSATFNVTTPNTYVSTTIQGNSTATGGAVTNLTGNNAPVTVTLGNSQAIVSGGGLATGSLMTISGTQTLNLNDGAGAVTIIGTAGQPSNLQVTPTGANSATVQDNGLNPVVNVTTTTTGSLTINGTPNDADTVQVNGTGGPDTIGVALGSPTTVTVTAGTAVYLPINVTTLTGNKLALVIGSGDGQDTINVSGSGGPASLLTIGGSPAGVDTLTYTTTVAGPTTVAASSTPGAGTITLPGGASFQFAGISTINVTGAVTGASTLTVLGSNGNDAFTASELNGANTVSINGQPLVTFTNYATLDLNGQGGSDSFDVSPSGLTGVTAINVAGQGSSDTDQLTVNGTSLSDAIGYTPTTVGAGTIVITPHGMSALATVSFTNMTGVSINGQGGGDTLTVNGTTGNDTLTVALGSAIDSGTAQVNSLTPLSYSNLGTTGASVVLAGGGGADTVNLVGHEAGDTYTVAPSSGQITVTGNAGTYIPISPTQSAGGKLALTLSSPGGSGQFNVSASNSTYTSTTIVGNSGAQGNAVANLTGDGTAVTVTVGPSGTTVTGGGLGTVMVSGTETLNLNNDAGPVTVSGTAGQGNNLVVTPNGTGASISDNGGIPLVNVTTTGTLTVDGTAGDNDTVTVVGTGGNDTIVASGGAAAPTITVNTLTPVALGANIAAVDVVETAGNNTLTVDSTAGAFPIPINFSGGPGTNMLTLLGGTATSDTYTPGPGTGAGSDVLVIGGATEQVNFTSLTPVFDNVPGPLTVMGTNGNDAITYAAPTISTNQGLFSVNNLETIEFGSKTSLTINTLGGTDAVNITNTTAQAGLTGITVNGGTSASGDTLTVNGTTAVDAVSYTPTALGAGTIAITPNGGTALPTVTFTNMSGVSYNGQGGGDTLTVNSTGAAAIGVTLGATVDSGTVYVNSDVPLSYSNLGATGSTMFGAVGTGMVVLNGHGGTDAITYTGHDNSDDYTIAPTSGAITSFGFPGLYTPVMPVLTGTPTLNLYIVAAGGSNTLTATAPLPYATTDFYSTGAAASSSVVSTLNGNGTAATVTLGNSSATITQTEPGGLGTVTVTGTETVDLNNGAGDVTVTGTAGQTNNLVVTPLTAGSAAVQDNGSSPLVNVSTTGSLVVPGTTGVANSVTVNGTSGISTIGVVRGTTTTVTVTGLLPVNVTSAAGNTLALAVDTGPGADTVSVSGTGGPASLTVNGGQSPASDTLNVTTTTAGTTTVTPGATNDSGTIATPDGTTLFTGMSFISVASTATGATLTANGTNSASTITAQHFGTTDRVWVNSQAVLTFSGYATLNLGDRFGNTTFNVTPTGMAVTTINVAGQSPNATDSLTVNGASGAAIGYTPSAVGAGAITIAGAPTVTFANVATAAVNGQGGGDILTVTGPSGATFNDALGSAVDSGTIQVNSFTPLAYSNLGANGSIVLAGTGGADHFNLTGPNPGDTYTVAATTGAVTIAGTAGTYVPITPTQSNSGTVALQLASPGGTATFNVTAPLPASYVSTTLLGNSTASGNAVTNLTESGSVAATVTLGNSSAMVSSTSLGTVTVSGTQTVNLNNGSGTVNVIGTVGQPNNISVTPTGAKTAQIQDNGLSPLVNLTTTATSPATILTIQGTAGDQDIVTVNSTAANGTTTTINAIGDTAPNTDTISVAPEAVTGGLLPINLLGLAGAVINAGLGNDNLIVNSTAGPFSIPITYDGGPGSDTLTLTGGTEATAANSDVYTPGPNPGEGNLALTFAVGGTESVSFANLSPVIDSVSGPLTVTGTDANNTITYTAGTVVTNGLIAVDNFESIQFTNKTILTIDGEGGDDTVIINNLNTPTGLTAINVDGGLGNNTLVVNAQDKLVVQSDITGSTVNIPDATPVPVGYTNTAHVNVINSIDQLTGVPLTPSPVNAPIVAVAGVSLIDLPVADFYYTDQPPAEYSTPSDFAATINWGDNTPATGGVITQLSAINGVVNFQVSGSHTYAAQGTYMISVTVTDLGSTRTFTLANTVNNQVINASIMANPGETTVPGPIVDTAAVYSNALISSNGVEVTGVEGLPITNAVIATFTDANPGASVANYPPGSIKVSWGDGTPIDTNVSVVQVGTSPNGTIFEVLGSHTYAEEGINYQITVTITRSTIINNVPTNGSTTVANSTATIADAALTPTAVPYEPEATTDINSTTAAVDGGKIILGLPFTAVVATFNDANPMAPASDFNYVTIDWGDGTPESQGIIIQPGGVGTTFEVLGTHTYTTPNTSGQDEFNTVISVHDQGGSTVVINATVTVTNPPISVNGILNPASDSGESNHDAITNVVQPNFFGTATYTYPDGQVLPAPGADVTLYATPVSGGPSMVIGQAEASSDGTWSITSNVALAQGRYVITATVADPTGNIIGTGTILPSATEGPLTIDVTGPKVTNVSFASRVSGEVQVTFQDDLGGLNTYEVQDAANYILTKEHTRRGTYLVNVISQVQDGPTGPDTVTLLINDGRQLRGGNYTFTIASGGGATGIRDVAGNPLDGEFYGYFPSGNNIPGGNFVAELNAVHHTIFAPGTIIGHATPVSPPGTPATGTTIPTANPQTPAGNPNFSGNPSQLQGERVHHRVKVRRALKSKAVVQKVDVSTATPAVNQSTSTDAHDAALEELLG